MDNYLIIFNLNKYDNKFAFSYRKLSKQFKNISEYWLIDINNNKCVSFHSHSHTYEETENSEININNFLNVKKLSCCGGVNKFNIIKLKKITHLNLRECNNKININNIFKKLKVININENINVSHKYYNFYSIDLINYTIDIKYMYLFSFCIDIFWYDNIHVYNKINIKHMFLYKFVNLLVSNYYNLQVILIQDIAHMHGLTVLDSHVNNFTKKYFKHLRIHNGSFT